MCLESEEEGFKCFSYKHYDCGSDSTLALFCLQSLYFLQMVVGFNTIENSKLWMITSFWSIDDIWPASIISIYRSLPEFFFKKAVEKRLRNARAKRGSPNS